ncbi:hypothetical protein [Paenibacillus sp. J5C2022]|uniref:hypothetical protein n=1 Tax=Paenibacillus sp. J5C2022 TaxID=2977129 RepID=UPI0021D2FAB4|nr:hypothetical protein [Paenibacillus sp. J5C2022]
MILHIEDSPNHPSIQLPHFPTRMQAVIWRNWGLVPLTNIAKVLGATEAQITEVAAELGLEEQQVNNETKWLERGYITIIRANWHLLPVQQLLQLLEWTEEKLAFTLKEDDFLWIKLGSVKPWTETVRYKELTLEERDWTRWIKETIAEKFGKQKENEAADFGRREQPFDFLNQYKQAVASVRIPFRKPLSGEVSLKAPWMIMLPYETALLQSASERFVREHEQIWGSKWMISEDAGSAHAADEGEDSSEKNIMRISIVPDDTRLAESHTISVTPTNISIIAVDEVGAMRGLQWLSKQMSQSGLPYIVTGEYRRDSKFETRIIYSYGALFGDPLLEPELDPYPDELLERLSDMGINGVWLQSVLYSLVPWEAAPQLSVGWEKRIDGLRNLVQRAEKYGIGVFLYCNEPRSMLEAFFADKPDWKGHTEDDGQAMLCTSHPDVQKLLSGAISRLFSEVPELAGLITITMSENWTHCYSRAVGGRTNCPRCSLRTSGEVTAEVNRLIAEGVFREKPDARILCWTWGWSGHWGWSEGDYSRAIEALPDNVFVMCTSEEALPTNIAGIPNQVIDYSMSNVGPGEKAQRMWRMAKERGLRGAAKVQFNNTWECSAVPFLPVFPLLEEHLANLKESGVSALMLSWTLGSYPSLNLELAAEYYWETDTKVEGGDKKGVQNLLQGKFGRAAGQKIGDASIAFSRAFREFPFDLNVLYVAPQNYGPANLLHLEPTGNTASMLGFPYDDLEGWRGNYPKPVFARQFKKLSEGWKEGVRLLEKARKLTPAEAKNDFANLMTAANAAYLHFYSTYLQISFIMARNQYLTSKRDEMKLRNCRKLMDIVQKESDNVRQLYHLVISDSKVGFEASNQYYYTVQDLKEKELNCRFIMERLRKAEGKMLTDKEKPIML